MKRIRLVSLLLATSMLFTACGGNTENVKEDNTNKNAIFKEDADVFQLEESDLSQITVCGDTIYVEQYVYDYSYYKYTW